MGKISGAFLFPHPPIMVEEIGRKDTQRIENTIQAAKEAAKRIAEIRPDTIVLITPHGTLFSDAVSIAGDKMLEGDFKRFGAPDVRLVFLNDLELMDRVVEAAGELQVVAAPIDKAIKREFGFDAGLDHGALVPLYFINKEYREYKLLHITYSLLPPEENYRFGIALKKAILESEKSVVVIASGDLSHKLTKEAPAGFHERGREYDQFFVDCIEEGNALKLMNGDPELLECAGECGHRSVLVLFGCLDGCDVKGKVLSYEGPFGVGYCVAELEHKVACPESANSKVLESYLQGKKSQLQDIRENEDPYVRLARVTLENYIRTGRIIDVPEDLPVEMTRDKAGVFVSIKKHGQLRGCIGTILPTMNSIASEIIQNAISAGTKDPRFEAIEEEELDNLIYSVDILMAPEDISSKEELDVSKYGVILKSGYRSGLLLPNLEGVDTVDEQIEITLGKAGIRKDEKYNMQRFEVIRHK